VKRGTRSERTAAFAAALLASHLVVVAGPVSGSAAPAGAEAALTWEVSREGVSVEAVMEPLEVPAEGSPFQEGAFVRVSFRVTDDATGKSYSALYPAAWMDRVPAGAERASEECKAKAENFLGGSLLAEPEVNLNVYYVLALNEDGTITVVDPLFGFGGTKLLAMVFLESPGEDWALAADGATLFVSMPASDRVAVVDTATWKVAASLDVGGRPVEVALQGDGRYLWVGTEGPREGFGGPGVTVVDTARREVARHHETGPGPHRLAFSDDGRFALVTGGGEGSVAVIDTASLEVVRRVPVAGWPMGIAWSKAAGAAYVSTREGAVVAVDPERDEPVARMAAEPGLGRIAFAPDGRLGFVVNPEADVVHIVDAARNRIVQTADVESAPDQVAFSDELAYIRHAESSTVLMIPLDTVGQEGKPVPVVDFPGGQRAPGEGTVPSPADAIVQAPGATAVLVANPADGVIYFYKEGMAAPMGDFRNYGRQPRAVQVVDRSLRDRGRGAYETVVQLRRPGDYDLVLYLDTPTLVRCFPFEVAVNPAIEREELAHRLDMELVGEGPALAAGEEATVELVVRDPETGAVRDDLDDLSALVFLAPGIWQRREPLEARGGGRYAITFTPPEEGLYYLFFQSPSVGMTFERSPSFILEAGGR
jgi:YVTN family beta-propeller protein